MGDPSFNKTFKMALSLAEQGDVHAQTSTGSCYFFGRGVEKNWKKAVEWYIKASHAGTSKDCMEAQFNMGYIYQHGGYGVEKDIKKSVEWLKKAEINKGMPPNKVSEICYTIGSIYSSDEGATYGLPRDDVQATQYLLRAMSIDKNPKACYNLGKMYMESNDEKKEIDSVRFFQMGADGGEGQCMFMLGQAYIHMFGKGVPINLSLAEQWMQRALRAMNNSPLVKEQLQKLQMVKSQVKAKQDQEESFFYKCAQCGTPDSQKKLLQCSKCKLVRYCSRECQMAHWKAHKPDCKAPTDSEPVTKKAISQVPLEMVDKDKWKVMGDTNTAHATGKIMYMVSKVGEAELFTCILVGLNAKVSKSDKVFMKEHFGDGTPNPDLGRKTLGEGTFLSWDVAMSCPYCNTRCKQGHFSVQFMFRITNGHEMRLRTIPRMWHFLCISPLLKALVKPTLLYPLEECKTVSVEEAWALADKDVQQACKSMANAINFKFASGN